MKTPCEIIRDLLPLYAENMTSSASNEMVEAHLGECESCTGYLEELRKPAAIPQDIEVRSLQKVTKSIQKQTILTAVTALFVVASLLTGLTAWLFHPIWLNAEEAILAVEEVEHGGLEFTVPGYAVQEFRAGAPSGIVHAWTTNHFEKMGFGLEKWLHPENAQPIRDEIHGFIETPEHAFYPYHPELADKYGVRMMMTEQNHWYWNAYEGRIAATLWDAGYPTLEDDYFVNAERITKQVFLAAVCILAISTGLAVVNKSKLGKVASTLAIVAGSHVAAALLMTDGRFIPVRWVSDPYPTSVWIWMLTLLFAVTALLVREQYRMKKKIGKIAVTAIAVILALVLVVFGGVFIFYNSMLGQISRPQLIEKEPPEEVLSKILPSPDSEAGEETISQTKNNEDIVNILVVGQGGRSHEEVRKADSTLLVSINKNTKTVTLQSVLRDTLVKYPAYRGDSGGQCKFSDAYAAAYAKWDVLGAMEVMDLLMAQNFGAEIDYHLDVDFEIFTKFIDAVGGVEVDLNEGEAEYLNQHLAQFGYPERKPGYHCLDGFSAMTYAQMRKTDVGGKRASRQRYLADQIAKKLEGMIQTEGISAVEDLCRAVLPYLTTDMENSQITKLMLELIPMFPELKLESGTIPVVHTYLGELVDLYGNGQLESVLKFDEEQNKRLIRAVTEGGKAG